MDCSLPGSSVGGILQARILEWVPTPPPGDLPDLETEQGFPAQQADSLLAELPGKPSDGDQAPNEDCGTGQACPHAFLDVNSGDRVSTEAWGVWEATLGCCGQGASLSGDGI